MTTRGLASNEGVKMKALLVDLDAWRKLTAIKLPKPIEEPITKIHFRTHWNFMPVIHTPYIMSTARGDEPLSIIKNFDHWFRVTLLRIEEGKRYERQRRREQSMNSAAL